MSKKLYKATRTDKGVECVVTTDDGSYSLPPCNEIVNHSPDGFEFGYSGSGPSQLALALCVDALADTARALNVYQRVRDMKIANVEGDEGTFTADEIESAAARVEAQRSGAIRGDA